MKRATALLLLIAMLPARGDLSEHAPEDLCALLSDFAIETAPFQNFGSGRPGCYTTAHPGSAADQYDFVYLVNEDRETDTRGLNLQARGVAGNFIGRLPHQLFLDMSERLLSQFFAPHEVIDVLAALRELGPNELVSAGRRDCLDAPTEFTWHDRRKQMQ